MIQELFAAGPIPTIQELEAQEAEDADPDSAFGEPDASAAGMIQQSDNFHHLANDTRAKAILANAFVQMCCNTVSSVAVLQTVLRCCMIALLFIIVLKAFIFAFMVTAQSLSPWYCRGCN